MKGGLYLVYTSLLTISVISSCVLFILVVSEAAVPGIATDSSGLSNVTEKKPAVPEPATLTRKPQDELEKPQLLSSELAFTEGLSQNSVIANGLPDTGQPPVLLSLSDPVQLEPVPDNLSIFSNHSSITSKDANPVAQNVTISEQPIKPAENDSSKDVPEPLVVRAKPMHEAKLAEEALLVFATAAPPTAEFEVENKTDVTPTKDSEPHEDIPSFSEWAQKQLAEAEKQDTVQNHSSQPSNIINNSNNKNNKLRSKNYASPACGAKVVAVNPEAGSASSILSPSRDEYMLNTCNSRIWFTVELCEPVQAQKIELANFELFSSSPKDFIVYFSDRFPTREWTSVGQFTAKNDKEIQSFDLYPHLFGKFIKVEMLSHYGSEHYCPISLFKVYGTSEFEVLEKENSEHPDTAHEDDDEILGDLPDAPISDDLEVSKNLFGSARDAVMSIMKKAAQVLVKSESPKNSTDQNNENKNSDIYNECCSPSHIIVCDNCSSALYNDVYDLISCKSTTLMKNINTVFMRETLRNTEICQQFGLDFRNKRTISFRNERAIYVSAMMSKNYIAALCNLMAIIDRKVVLNSSQDTELNVTLNLTLDKVSNIVVNENNFNEIVQIPFKNFAPQEEKEMPKQPTVSTVPEKLVTLEEEKQKAQIPDKPPSERKQVVEEINEINTKFKETKVENHDSKEAQQNEIEENRKIPEKHEATEGNVSAKAIVNVAKAETPNVKSESPTADLLSTNLPTDKQPLPSSALSEEIPETLVIEAESFLTELDTLISEATVQPTIPNIGNNQPPQKESVFLRLSNRVKTLERNMSLSAQYLEELSRRYKKQVEEMQKSFDKTILQINEEKKRTEERDQQNMEQLVRLQEQLSQLEELTKDLSERQDGWFGNVTFFRFLVLQMLTVVLAFYYFKRKSTTEQTPAQMNKKTPKNKKNQEKRQRRSSVESVGSRETVGKQRRPSEEAMHIARQSTEEADEEYGDWQPARKNRRRKTSVVYRAEDWMQQDSIGVLRESVIPLDEEEFIAPVSEPKQFNAELVAPKEMNKTNGISKLKKSRRLSSPAFLRAALGRQSSSGSPAANGSGSRSPSASLRSDVSTPAAEVGSASDAGSIKQSKRRSFKSIFKKVF